MRYGLAVELGTTSVSAAVGLPGGPETALLGDRSATVPAVVHLAEDGTLLTGEAAARRATSAPARTVLHLRRRLGEPTPVMIAGLPFAISDLMAALLRDVVAEVTRARGAAPVRIALTRPANWGPTRLGLLEDVARRAGIAAPVFVGEPEAVAAHYAEARQLPPGALVAVYDLGGGTFDAAVLRRVPRGMEPVGLGEGIEELGGVDLDDALLRYVDYRSGGAVGALDATDPASAVAVARLREECTLAKEALSVDTAVDLPVYLPGAHLDLTVTRAELEVMLRGPVESSIGALVRALRGARVPVGDLTAVVLAGGSARIPMVARMVREALLAEAGGGRVPPVEVLTEPAAVLGAARSALIAGPAHPGYPGESGGPDPGPGAAPAASGRARAAAPPLPATPPPSPPRTGPSAAPSPPGASPAGTRHPGSPAPEPHSPDPHVLELHRPDPHPPVPSPRAPSPPLAAPTPRPEPEHPPVPPSRKPDDARPDHDHDWPVRSSMGRGVAVAVAVLAVVAAVLVLVFVVLNRVRDASLGPEPGAPAPPAAVAALSSGGPG
ncbi:Hsp70 family protein [Pseudonocardia xishanensis]|uniref:Hsp70 protein n=1 Tax=Pseudonocardia xishanensis TaxID=630995 RepID=A0ABP8RVT9_9PSEU